MASYRSGVAARLAGLPVETLRVWERRYGLSDTHRSEHGQRLYTPDQVRRLGLLKQLVDQGNPIGSIAGLPVDQLAALAAAPAAGKAQGAGPVRVAVVGEGLRRRIAAEGRHAIQIDVLRGCDKLDQAGSALRDTRPDVLLIELSEIDAQALPVIAAVRQDTGAAATLVLYRFCASATIRELRAQGCLVARVPAEIGELVMLCRTAAVGTQLAPAPAREPIAPRRFDDARLGAYAASGNRLECECPRHLSDLLMMVSSFERYSAQCASRNEADAELHADLEYAAGAARMILEGAMAQLVLVEGLDKDAG